MSIIQEEQVQKYLTIDELMPTWSQLLDLYLNDEYAADQFKEENNLVFLSTQRCCVGEAWKFKDGYAYKADEYCDMCSGFSFKNGLSGGNNLTFSTVIGQVRSYDNHNWRDLPVVKEFVKHFNEKHVNT